MNGPTVWPVLCFVFGPSFLLFPVSKGTNDCLLFPDFKGTNECLAVCSLLDVLDGRIVRFPSRLRS
jgi:hypothetical protein